MHKIDVNLKENRYIVAVDKKISVDIKNTLTSVLGNKKVLLIAEKKAFEFHGDALVKSLTEEGIEICVYFLEISESLKTIETVTKMYDFALAHKFDRNTHVIAMGGGVTGDLVGFFAATYQRGIPFIQMPTTLLAMVDSSVGGKVAYNHPMGKNMIGAFYQPKTVLIITSYLETLPPREFACGLAECIKHGLLADHDLFEWMIQHSEKILSKDPDTISELIAKNVAIKAQIVAEDEKEQGRRALLNLGHTFGHAIEVTSGYGKIEHGEAVALGCVAASFASLQLGYITDEDHNKILQIFKCFNLPVKENLAPMEDLIKATSRDKKSEGGKTKFILLKAIGEAYIEKNLSHELISEAFQIIKN